MLGVMVAPKEFLLELDGPGVAPENVDTLLLLRLAEASFRLAIKVSETGKTGLSFQGLRVLDKCVAIAAVPNNFRAAKLAGTTAIQIVSGAIGIPRGCEDVVDDVRAHLRRLPSAHKAKLIAGGWSRRMVAPEVPSADHPWERTELRARPIRVGGAGAAPRTMLTSDSEPGSFLLDATRDQARKLGAVLYKEVDVVLDVCRDIDGRISQGRIVEVHELGDDEPVTVWRDWFATNGEGWNEVENVLEGLERGHD
jgi:hypothetical protein